MARAVVKRTQPHKPSHGNVVGVTDPALALRDMAEQRARADLRRELEPGFTIHVQHDSGVYHSGPSIQMLVAKLDGDPVQCPPLRTSTSTATTS